jgi:putative acetyltransferase
VICSVIIREATELELSALLAVERNAFGEEEGSEIVELVSNLLADPSAKPLLSLVALENEQVIGHILFTRAQVDTFEQIPSVILAPLAVAQNRQNQGIGGLLIKV